MFPAPALFQGLGQLAAKNRAGHKSYLLGEVRTTGWWYFFPVALAVKTPFPFLLLLAAGLVVAAWRDSGRERRRQLEPAAIAFAILLVCLPSRINIGLRHVLPMYPFLAISRQGVGSGALAARRRRLRSGRWRLLLVGWQVVASARAASRLPRLLQRAGGGHPERILVDSDLDDGQDLKRLADTLRARRIPAVWLAYAGSATVAEHGLPPIHWLEPHQPVTGWVAASLYSLKLGSLDRPGHDDFAWLEHYQPVPSSADPSACTTSPDVPAGRAGMTTSSSAGRYRQAKSTWPSLRRAWLSNDIPGSARHQGHLGEGGEIAQAGQARTPATGCGE